MLLGTPTALKSDEIENFQTKWIKLTNKEDFIVQEFQNNVIKKGEIAVMLIEENFHMLF